MNQEQQKQLIEEAKKANANGDKAFWLWLMEMNDKINFVIILDNDSTSVNFDLPDPNEPDWPFSLSFSEWLGNSDGVFELLETLNFNTDGA
jgi:hypothetical protein